MTRSDSFFGLLTGRLFALFLFLSVVFVSSNPAIAQDDEDGEVTLDLRESYDFKKLSGMDARLTPHGDDLMGDLIDKNTGGISFQHTDISIPGNSGLEVALRRKKGQGAVPFTPFQHGFGDWVIDIPIAHVQYGHDSNASVPVFDNGCLNTLGPMNDSVRVGNSRGTTWLLPDNHVSGAVLHVPGKGLSGYPGSVKTPADPASDWTSGPRTTDFAGRCATVVVAPDGTKYKFGRHTFRLASSMSVPFDYLFCNTLYCYPESTVFYLSRTHAVYLVTEVVDVHGNWVRYDYTNDDRAELTRIYSNDGREINLYYADFVPDPRGRNSRRITHATANGRTWNFEYTGSSPTPPPEPPPPPPPGPGPGPDPCLMLGDPRLTEPDRIRCEIRKDDSAEISIAGAASYANTSSTTSEPYRFLHKVILPDGRFWRLGDADNYGMRNIQYEPHLYYLCVPYDVTFDLKHPDGAIGTFRLRETRHIKGASWLGDVFLGDTPGHYMWEMNIPNVTDNSDCNGTHSGSSGEFPWERPDGWPVYQAMSVASKSISGAGLPTATWNFEYRNYSGGALDNNWTKITGPDGTERTYTYQAVGEDHGLLKSIEVDPASGAGETILYEHNQHGGGAPGGFYGACRAEMVDPTQNSIAGRCKLYDKRPVTKVTHQRDGDTYSTEYNYNFNPASSSYASKPATVKKYSTISGSTAPRITDTTYEHKTAKWIRDLPKSVTRNGRQLATYAYDSLGRKTSQTRYGQFEASFTYHADGSMKTTTDALGRQVYATNYKRGIAQNIRRPDNRWVYATVDNNGWVMSRKDALQRTTYYSRDNMGRLTLINPPGSWANTSISYNFSGGGAVQTITKGQSRETITYDKMYRPILERTQALDTGWSSYLNTRYNAAGQVEFKSQPSTNPSETKGVDYTYDGLGRIYQERENVSPYATTKHRYYSSARHRIYDPSGAFTQYYSYGYDGPGNTDYRAIYKYANGAWQQYTYLYKNVHGQMTRLRQWGYNHSYQDKSQYFYYDPQQRLCRHYVPEHGATKYQYDAAGQMIAYAKGQGNSGCGAVPSSSAKVTQYYDALGQPTLTNFSDASTPDISRTYDAIGNLKTVNRGGVNWSYNYNDINLLTSESLYVDGRSYNLAYYYNNSEHLTRKVLPTGRNVYITPDGIGRARTIVNNSSYLASNIGYHANGSVSAMTYGNGQYFTQTLNARLLPHRLLSYKGSQMAIYQTFGYDARGKVTSITDSAVGGNNRTYGYDGLGRLISATGPWGTGSYTYDSLDNIRQKRLGSRTVNLTYDGNNRLTQSADTGASGTRALAYDARGNVRNLGSLAFNYDYSDQPVTVSGATSGTYKYDGNLKRVKSVVNGKIIYNVYDLGGSLVHIDAVTDNKKTDYVSGPNGPLARITNHVPTFLHPNHLGSAQSGTNGAGNVIWREKYTPFGEELNGNAANDDQAGFTGHIRDKATGLNYMQARYYDPVIGRFLSVDPVTFLDSGDPEMFNRYSYAYNDPTNLTDPTGKCPWCIGAVIGGLVEAATIVIESGGDPRALLSGASAKRIAVATASGAVGGGIGSAVSKSVMRTVAGNRAANTGLLGAANRVSADAIGGAVGGAADEVTNQLLSTGGIEDGGAVLEAFGSGMAIGAGTSALGEAVEAGTDALGAAAPKVSDALRENAAAIAGGSARNAAEIAASTCTNLDDGC